MFSNNKQIPILGSVVLASNFTRMNLQRHRNGEVMYTFEKRSIHDIAQYLSQTPFKTPGLYSTVQYSIILDYTVQFLIMYTFGSQKKKPKTRKNS